MKGLLLKDWYMMKKYCKAYLLIAIVFIAVSFAGDDNVFFIFYPCLLCGMIPVTLLGYDERSRWIGYSGTLPYARTQIVSSKFLIGLFSQLAMLIVTGIVQGIRMGVLGSSDIKDFAFLMLMLLAMSSFTSICLPFIFKFGIEKGRIAYYVMIGLICVIGVPVFTISGQDTASPEHFYAAMVIIGIAVYALSWYLSIVFYKKREI